MLARPWQEADYCVIDVETTGLDLRRDCIVSYGLVRVTGGRVHGGEAAYQLVRPECPISDDALRVHGLRPADVSDAPAGAEVFPRLRDALDGCILVAHAAWIEQAFLSRALRSIGARLTGPVIDTAALCRAAELDHTGSAGREPSLEGAALSLGLEPHNPHHAVGDALTTAELLIVLAARLNAVTASDLVRHTRSQRARTSSAPARIHAAWQHEPPSLPPGVPGRSAS
jgi:DNA polymerase-3 subunit epsilon